MLTDLEASAPPPQHWSWRKIVLWLLGILAASVIAILAYDQKLEPYDDLIPVRATVPDASKNGYLFLKERWEKLPEGTKEERDQVRDMVNGKIPWNEALAVKSRIGRESAWVDLKAALALPEYLTPPVLEANDPNLSNNAWIAKPYMHLAMEAIASARGGDSAAAVSLLEDMHLLVEHHIKGSGSLLSLLIGTSLHAVLANVTCEILDQTRLKPEEAAAIAAIWDDDPPVVESWRNALQSEAAFTRDVIEKAGRGIVSEGFEKPKLGGLFMKKNQTLNKAHARLRNILTIAFVPFSSLEAAERAGWTRRVDQRSKLVKNLDANYTGNQYLEESDFTPAAFLPRLTSAILFSPRALRVRVALYRWRMIHAEQWPENLKELVPEFLPSVPLDPFDGKRLSWDPESQLIYSVGSDWKISVPVFDREKHAWFADDPESPGLRLDRPPSQPSMPSKLKPKPAKPVSAPTISPAAPASSN